MPPLVALLGAVAGFGSGWVAGAFQHNLYRQPEFRAEPATGRKALLIRAGLGITTAAAAALALRPDHYDAGPAIVTAGFCAILLILASTDFERRLLPNRLVYPALAAALAVSWAWPDRTVADILYGLAFTVAVGALLFGAGLLLGGAVAGLGMGDAKLMVLIGALTGWPAAMSALLFGILLGGLPALALMAAGKRRARYSYGPYLVAGTLIVLLLPGRFT